MKADSPQVVRSAQMPADTPQVAVAIVGAGACGLTAALMLADAGVECVVLERDAAPSGSTALSSGFIPAAGTQAQRAQGIDDTPEQFARDIQAKAHGNAAPHLVQAYANAVGPALDALADRHGLQFEVLRGLPLPRPQRRTHACGAGAHRRGADDAAAARGGCRRHRRGHGGAGARTVGGRGRSGDRPRLPAARRQHRAAGLPRCAAGLQRLRRQPGTGARVAARDGERHLRRPRRQRRQRHRLGPSAGRATGRPRRLSRPRLLGHAAGRADFLGADDRGRHPGQPRRAALPRRDPGLFRSCGAGAGAARRRRLGCVRRSAAGLRAAVSRFPRGAGGRRGAHCE